MTNDILPNGRNAWGMSKNDILRAKGKLPMPQASLPNLTNLVNPEQVERAKRRHKFSGFGKGGLKNAVS